jgi:hypothetical protein
LRFKNIHFTDGLQELKVFVDLAYISTGDDGIACSNYDLNSAYQIHLPVHLED